MSSNHTVTAVLVVHNGARWLPETIAALAEQTRQPDIIRIVDTGSTDRSAEIIVEAAGDDRLLRLPRRTGFGAAVSAALTEPLEARRGRRAMPQPTGSASWVWLLHDDAAPAPDALESLLAAADQSGGRRYGPPGVLGCKHRDWYDRKVLLGVGLTTDLGARRETGVDPGEHDQGQYDDVRDVLAVDSAGMLVRREVWDQLGGFDPMLPLYRDDIDFCWRAARAGYRVQVVSNAVVYHAEAASRHRRAVHAAASHARIADRRHGMYSLATNLPLGLAAFALVRTALTSALRAVGWLLAKQIGYAFDELAALVLVVVRPDLVVRGRSRRHRLPQRWREVRMLMPPRGAGLRRVGERIAAFSAGVAIDPGRHHAASELAQPASDDDAFGDSAEPGLVRRALRHPGLLLVVALALLALVAERGVLGTHLAGGALLPAPDGASDLWQAYLSAWHPVGIGSAKPAPPYLGALALVSTIFFGKPAVAVAVLLLGCVPLAGWTAYLASKRLGADRAVRVWVSAAYALLPVATGAIAAGRLGTALAFVILPLIAHYAGRVLSPPRRGALRPAWSCGLFVSIATAFAPVVWPIVVLLGIVAAVMLWRRRAVLSGIVFAALMPLLLLYPWSFSVIANPHLLLLDTGYHPAYLAADHLHPLALLLFHPGGPGMYPVWIGLGVVTAALAALLRGTGRRPVVAGWIVAVTGLVTGTVLSRLSVADVSEASAIVWPGVAAAVVGVGLLVAVASAAQDAPERLFRYGFGWRQLVVVALVIAAGAMPLLAGAWWVVNGVDGPLRVVHRESVPAYLTAQSNVPSRPRTLVIERKSDHVQYTVVHGEAPELGDGLLQPEPGNRLDGVVADLVSGRVGNVPARLAPYNIRYVVVAGGVDPTLAERLDGEDGLIRQSATDKVAVWKALVHTARARVLEKDGTMHPVPASGDVGATITVPPGASGRVLVLADAASDGWRATVDGHALSPREIDGWAQGFALPASGGKVHLAYENTPRHGQLVVQGLALLVVIVLALPAARREEGDTSQEVAADAAATRRHHGRLEPGTALDSGEAVQPVAPRGGAQ
ncbi:MAG: glycosyltransferase [Streptosporangiales bacterium]